MRITSSMAFRLDDITPDMDWDRFYRVKAIFDKYHVEPLLGVVPDNRDPELKKGSYREDFWDVVLALKKNGWVISQHGYMHIYETSDSGLLGLKKASEFAGLPFKVQMDKILKGQTVLKSHGISTDIFMAPGHTFDRKTIKALRKSGFKYASDGYTDIPCKRGGIVFIPCRRSSPGLSTGMDTICIHCNDMEEADYRELERFLETNRSKVIPFSEIVNQLWYPRRSPVLALGERLNLLREGAKRRLGKNRKIKNFIQKTYDPDGRKKIRNRIKGLPALIFTDRFEV